MAHLPAAVNSATCNPSREAGQHLERAAHDLQRALVNYRHAKDAAELAQDRTATAFADVTISGLTNLVTATGKVADKVLRPPLVKQAEPDQTTVRLFAGIRAASGVSEPTTEGEVA